jgi:CRISPR/Cas system CSM-associated protein Csm4 (group 5 of RAMP superfamily)
MIDSISKMTNKTNTTLLEQFKKSNIKINRCTADTVKICENRLKTPKMQTAAIIHKKTYIMIKKRKKKLTPTYKTPQKKLTIEQYEPL